MNQPSIDIANRLLSIKSKIHALTSQYQRNENSVDLLAVSKGQSTEAILSAHQAGQQAFGENYLQEALTKIETLQDAALCWHFIGNIQSNKTRDIAMHFDWAHGVNSVKVAQRLAAQRPADRPPLNCCIQVNIDADPQKQGLTLAEVNSLALAFAQWPCLRLRGLMTISRAYDDERQQRQIFAQLYQAQQDLIKQGLSLDTLSMGMSRDYPLAIAEGATIIRVGTAIFGERHT